MVSVVPILTRRNMLVGSATTNVETEDLIEVEW